MCCLTTCVTRRLLPALLVLGLPLLAPGAAWADITYKIQSIVKQGDQVGDPPIEAGSYLTVGSLNDNGQILFDTLAGSAQSVVQYADGKFTLLLVGGRDGLDGKWPNKVGTFGPMSMNQQGNLVFAAQVTIGGKTSFGTFLWDYQTQKLTAVALQGMPAVNNVTFADGGGWAPVINNHNDIALVAKVKNAAGTAQNGIFFLGRDGKLVPVALPDQALPGGAKVIRAWLPSINDAGLVAFLARQEGDAGSGFSGYLWEQGTITPLLRIDADAPGGGKITNVRGVWVNNQNRNVLVLASVQDSNNNSVNGLYRLAGGKLTPLVVPGQEMPGGGEFQNVLTAFTESWPTGVSIANDAGQHAFLAVLEDKTTAAYLLDTEGKLSLILKSGTSTDLGAVTRVGTKPATPNFVNGIGLNNKGQVALAVQITAAGGAGAETLVLLTPTTP